MNDCIYLTTAQIETLYKLSIKGEPIVGIQLRGNASADSLVICDAVLKEREQDIASATILDSGTSLGWSY